MVLFAYSRTWLAGVTAVALAAASLALAPTPAQANGCITPAPGTAGDPYLISTPGNLNCLMSNADYYWAGGFHFRQTADLDMSNYAAWIQGIGSDDTAFNGTYDGNGFSIDNLTITSSGSGVGLFGVATGATLHDITTTNLQVSGDRQVGGLVGRLDGGTIEQANIQATVSGACSSNLNNCYVGGLVGQVDDSAATTIAQAWTSGSITAAAYGRGAGGLVGGATPSTLTVTDSYSSAAVTGYDFVGGLVGVQVESSWNEVLSVVDSYASGPVAAGQGTPDVGGLIGCFYDNFVSPGCGSPNGTVNVTDTYWDTQTTGRATTAGGRGSARTTAQMTSLGTFGNWSIDDVTPNLNTTWGICPALNDGYPFLQWISAHEGWSCAPPDPTPPPPPTPATPPIGVTAQPGDASASVSWSAPASTGSYAVSHYLVTSSPDSGVCITSTTSCKVTGLRNGTPYTFTVEALTGAGWSSPSEPSPAVVPVKARSIVITGSRSGATAVISGTASGMSGETLAVMVRFRGETSFADRGSVAPDSRGIFTWRIRTGKTLHAYVAGDGLTSNRVIIPRSSTVLMPS